MHPSTDASPDSAANEPRLTYAAANKIIKKLSPDMVENIFKFISGEEVMRATDIARILSYLGWKDIMRARVSKKWRDAVEMTLPTSEFAVDSVRSYNAMNAMAGGLLSNLQQLSICALGDGHKYCDGEDPFEEWDAETAHVTTHDITIISNLRKLRSLSIIGDDAPLNGIYPVLFTFPLLQKFTIVNGDLSDLKWNLEMLSGLPSLKELVVIQEDYGGLSGNLRSLRVLKDTLEKVDINYCPNIKGNVMDLADFPRLKVLYLWGNIVVRGDVRDINEHDFPALESLLLPKSVRGGIGYKFHSITEVPSFMHAIHRHRLLQRLLQRNPDLLEYDWNLSDAFGWSISKQSPDWYDRENGSPEPPFDLQIIQVGPRLGWSWRFHDWRNESASFPCEINWLDPEPSSNYEAYSEELQRIQHRIGFYRGYYYKPPNAVEYRLLCEGLEQRD
eukprot:scaffold15094_cov223-Skeletonema_dohrnii-CCMP3373.AAC.1